MRNAFTTAVLLGWFAITGLSQAPPLPEDYGINGTAFLDHNAPLAGFFGKTFLQQNIPYIDIPDKNIESIYYFRLGALSRHLNYAFQGANYLITEFIQPVPWAGFFNSIDAAAGHQISEARWLRSKFHHENYIDVWTRGPGASTEYTHWIQNAAVGAANVTGDLKFIQSQLSGMINMWHMWDGTFNETIGLNFFLPLWDAQEFSLPGYVADAAQNNTDPNIIFPGPNTYRPSLNSYMVANAEAIAYVASSVQNSTIAAEFTEKAAELKAAMITHLWNSTQQFFVDNIVAGQPGEGQVAGREAVGFYPFRFGIGLEKQYTEPSLTALFDPQGFKATYFPTSLEIRNQYYQDERVGCCYWNGQTWPFTSSHVLGALAEMYRANLATANQYHKVLSNFARMQHKNNTPFIAESHYPTADVWGGYTTNHSEFYQHSTFVDNVITQLLGLIPRGDDTLQISPIIPAKWKYFALENVPYHGFLITILYDKTGTRYKAGTGLSVYANGKKIYQGAGRTASIQLPAATPSTPSGPSPSIVNVVANPMALDGLGVWPRASATFSGPDADPYKAIDGYLFYDEVPDNRWTNLDPSQWHANDTLTIQLQRPRQLPGVALAIIQDVGTLTNGSIACPSAIEITDGAGNVLASLNDFKSSCLPNDVNVITFSNAVTTDTIMINFFAQAGMAVGVTEVQLWVPANAGPLYLAADAMASYNIGYNFSYYANIAFDSASTLTSNGAVMQLPTAQSAIRFAGIYSANGATTAPRITYKNNGTSSVTLSVILNNVVLQNIMLPTTGAGYKTRKMPAMSILPGNNFLTLQGGGAGVFIGALSVK